MPAIASAILITWSRNRGYAHRLVGDLSDEQFVAQPIPGVLMNHPAWVLSHLNAYAPICAALASGTPFEDPIDHPHGQKSEVRSEAGAYLARGALIESYLRLHDAAQDALAATTEAVLSSANPIERWRTMHPTVGDMLVTLMVKHEAAHLGQLSAWRRAMGLGRVAM